MPGLEQVVAESSMVPKVRALGLKEVEAECSRLHAYDHSNSSYDGLLPDTYSFFPERSRSVRSNTGLLLEPRALGINPCQSIQLSQTVFETPCAPLSFREISAAYAQEDPLRFRATSV